jgi:hypothetical protein
VAQTPTFDVQAAHRWFAVQFNNEAWDLLERPSRTVAEEDRLLSAAYAAWEHWSQSGTPLNAQRARHLLAHAHAAVGHGELALRHAAACMALSEQNGDAQSAFDRAAAVEGLARAHACAGGRETAARLRAEAQRLAADIPADERAGFESLLRSGRWHSLE